MKDIVNLVSLPFDEKLIHQTKRCLMDYLGSTVAGATMLGHRSKTMIDELHSGDDCTLIGFGQQADMYTAAFINGFSSHIAELDDGVISGIIHPGAPILSALLPVAEKYSCSFEKLLQGIVAGYETSVRLANTIQPSHKKRGYHATATCGLIGAAVAIGVMRDFSFPELKATFAVASASSHGTLKVLEDNSELKPFNVATAAANALTASIVGKAGFNVPNDPLSGDSGFFAQNTDDFDLNQLFRHKNTEPLIFDVYVKPYAACRYCHPSIDNALKLGQTHSLNANEIKSILIRTYSLAVNKHDHTDVQNVTSAKMSIPFATAVSLLHGKSGIEDYTDETIKDSAIVGLMKKIRVESNPSYSEVFPNKSIADMEVEMIDGTKFYEYTDLPKGESMAPLSDKEMEEKFLSLARYAGVVNPQDIVDKINSDHPNIKQILKLLS
ncbi:MAG: MmgE/PrpD family protein [Bacteroidales bacterium]|nr:MmgE/PrpD family protein [Bacteroidales bacterium]